MVKLPLLASKLERSAAALLLSVLLPPGIAAEQAFAGAESSEQTAPAPNSGPSEKKAEETPKQPAAEAAKPAGETAKPAGEAAKEVSGEQKPAEAKPAEAKAAGDAAAAGPKDANAVATPAEGEAGSKSLTKPGEAGAAPLVPAAPKDVKTAAKPASAAEASAKPKDLSPKPDGAQNLRIQASSVNAVYNIHFLGAHIGEFKIHSSITNRQYKVPRERCFGCAESSAS